MSDEDKVDPTQSGDAGNDPAQSGQTGDGKTADAQSGGTDAKAEDTVSRSDFDRLRTQLQAADRRRQEFETELRALKDKDLPELEKFKRDAEANAKQVEQLQSQLKDERIKNAFLTANTYTWHSPAAAMKLLDMSSVDIDAEGNVSGLKEALKRLASEHPFLIKAEEKPEDKPAETPATPGTPPMNGKASTNQTNSKELRTRFKGLRARS
jgi:hypothetical protein